MGWDPSPSPDVAGYNLYYGTGTRSYTNMAPVGNVTNTIISGLVEGVTYYFAATATNATGLESDYSNEVTYSVPVVTANQPPTLDGPPDLTINENAGVQTVNLTGITSGAVNEIQTLTVTATSSNNGLIPDPAVNYTSPNSTGALSFTPVSFASGSVTITVTVDDGGAANNIITQSFLVTVNPVNQPPTLNALSDLTINANAGVQTINLAGITSGAFNELQTLTVTATSSNPGLVPNPAVNYTSPNFAGSLSFSPMATGHGSATITVTVNDGGATDNIVNRSFNVAVNQPPVISALINRVITVGAQTPAIPFTISDAQTAVSSLTLSGTSSNPALVQNTGIIFGGSGANRTVTVTPLAGQSGDANITVTVSDGLATSSSTFQLAVQAKPAPPGNFHFAGP